MEWDLIYKTRTSFNKDVAAVQDEEKTILSWSTRWCFVNNYIEAKAEVCSAFCTTYWKQLYICAIKIEIYAEDKIV